MPAAQTSVGLPSDWRQYLHYVGLLDDHAVPIIIQVLYSTHA